MKGVILAAGYGSRFLPATKSVPKEMFPLIDRPALDFIVDEFVRSGIEDILLVTSRRKKAIEDYFDRDPELENALAGKPDRIARLNLPPARFLLVRQPRMGGTGDALMLARPFTGDDPFVVAYPDDLHFGAVPLAEQLITVYNRTGCSVLATLHDPPQINRYGVLKVADDGLHVADIVEKPPLGREPSREASIGRFLYTPEIYEQLERGIRDHTGGEYFHTPALRALAAEGRLVFHRTEGDRLDIGAPEGYLRAILRYARMDSSLSAVLDDELKR